MNYKFHSEAKREVISAARHYKNIHTRLGKDFRNEIERTISRILENPKAWHPTKKKYRRCLLRNFPFELFTRWMRRKMFV